jgi:ribonuclease G
VVVDFVDLKSKDHRRQVVEALGRAVAADPCACSVGSMSRLGLVEMTRRRRGPSLAAQLTRACPACGGVGRVAGPAAEDVSGGGT